MSIFFDLPMNLRELWWGANTLEDREAVEEEFRVAKSAEVPEKYAQDYKKMLTVMGSFLWTPLKHGLCSEQGEQVGKAMKSFLEAYEESERLEKELQDHIVAWNTSYTPNTDQERVAKYWDTKTSYECDLKYARIHDAVLYDELLNLIG